eukprot:TRINITY_DN215_c0_g1_i1.p1 TRINITY_DN215_c0_g1~~TRINITY_DN215_c0_g1_i1.p1  ORF type:complete len:273 (+),score=54.62 TRINITY_DN215_c0_g1_i1:2-820(+)
MCIRERVSTQSTGCAVVGVGDGIGRSVSLKFAREGYDLALISRKIENTLAVKKEIEKSFGSCRTLAVSADAGVEENIQEAFSKIRKDLGDPSVLIYNAAARRIHPHPFLTLPTSEFEGFWKANCLGAFLCAKEVIPGMLKQEDQGMGKGTIIFTGATASMRSLGGMSSFSVGKFGLRALAQSLQREFSPQGVHICHVVVDGPVDKPLIVSLVAQNKLKRPNAQGNNPPKVDDIFAKAEDIACQYWSLHQQPKSIWTFELDLRPYAEPMFSSL